MLLESSRRLCFLYQILSEPRLNKVNIGTQTLQNEIVFYNPQEPIGEELTALLISKSLNNWKEGRDKSKKRSSNEFLHSEISKRH
ncbi:hypothetical protein EB796_024795 [Bugula neritina]|uniref:Uncharacterized protein n=1 Tax=Bugula neritina TaxID=10212 RepID=A0A7J7ITJ8_BUGNE|nr:hypothetical protein EB796_024795 [Bugula neritina]